MAGALGLAGGGLGRALISRRKTPAPAVSTAFASSFSLTCYASLSPRNASWASGRNFQRAVILRSAFMSRSIVSSFWDCGVGGYALALAVEGSFRQSRGGKAALGAQMDIFECFAGIVQASRGAESLQWNPFFPKGIGLSSQVCGSSIRRWNIQNDRNLSTIKCPGVECDGWDKSLHTNTSWDKKSMEKDLPWTAIKNSALRRAAGFLVGSTLLVLTIGLGLARPAGARSVIPSTLNTPYTQEIGKQQDTTGSAESEDIRRESTREARDESINAQPKDGSAEDPAELVLETFLERHPGDLKALEGLMYVRLRKGSVQGAIEVMDKMLSLRPNHIPWQLVRAQSLDFVGDLDQARKGFETILESDPLSARALQGLAIVMTKEGEEKEVLEMLQRAVIAALKAGKAKEATNLRMLLGQMLTLQVNGEFKEFTCWLNCMLLLGMGPQGNLEAALEQYKDVIKDDPCDFRPYLCQGLVYSILGKTAEAEKEFRKYHRLCPKTFPDRDYLDDLMLSAKSESRRTQEWKRHSKVASGKKAPKRLKQPAVSAAMDMSSADD